jgi:hypothetical protein
MNPRFSIGNFLRRLGVLLAVAAIFSAGYFTCLKTHHTTSPADTARMMQPAGDAPADVRSGVQATLNTLEQAYLRRDPSQIDALMNAAFAPNADVITLGAEGLPYEWVRGPAEVRSFIQRDWQVWGLFRFDPTKAIVWSSGNVAWVATLGEVEFQGGSRQIRFTAVLEKRGDKWVFRQMQFQWNDGAATAGDLVRPQTYLTLIERELGFSAR